MLFCQWDNLSRIHRVGTGTKEVQDPQVHPTPASDQQVHGIWTPTSPQPLTTLTSLHELVTA